MTISKKVVASLFLFLLAGSASADCLVPAWDSLSSAVTSNYNRVRDTIAVADFNEDGLLDAVTITTETPVNAVRLTPGTLPAGSFGPPVTVHSGPTLHNLAAKDVNGDGSVDLLILEGYDGMALLPGLGDGTFAPPVRSAMLIGSNWMLDDFTGDEVPDIVGFTYEESGAKLTLFTGTAAGTFSETRRTPLGVYAFPTAAGDLDGDTAVDLVLGNADATISFVFGNGDGTFDPVVTQPAGVTLTAATLADVEGDGDLDVLMSAPSHSLLLYRNLGGRSFATPETHLIDAPGFGVDGRFNFAAADFTGDGIRDLIATGVHDAHIATLRGKGDGTFHAPSFDRFFLGNSIGQIGAVADLDGDDRLDLITFFSAGPSALAASLLNRCGDTAVSVISNPVVSTGTAVTYDIDVKGAPLRNFVTRPVATGSVSLFEGDTLLATATLVEGAATVTVPARGIGEHALIARYTGDVQYEPAQSAPFAQQVTTETTTTVVTTTPSSSVYGELVHIRATVTASNGATPTGMVDLFLGPYSWDEMLPGSGGKQSQLLAGTHFARARYRGSATLAPSEATITHVVHKAPSKLEILALDSMNASGSNILILVDNSNGRASAGTIRLYDGDKLVSARPRTQSRITFALNGLAPGPHHFRAEYSGDSNYLPSTSATKTHQTLPWNGRRRGARH